MGSQPFAHDFIGCLTIDVEKYACAFFHRYEVVSGFSVGGAGFGQPDFTAGYQEFFAASCVFYVDCLLISVNIYLGYKTVGAGQEFGFDNVRVGHGAFLSGSFDMVAFGVEFQYLEHMTDVALTCVLFHIEEIFGEGQPFQIVFIAADFGGLTQLTCPDFNITAVHGVIESHEAFEVDLIAGDGGLLEEFAVGGVFALLALFYLSADQIVKPFVWVFAAFAHQPLVALGG